MMEDLSSNKIICTQNFGRILLTGEELRHQMHGVTSGDQLIKDHWHHFKTYQCTFVGSEATAWLINNKHATDREMSVNLMNILLENGVLHHVSDSQPFKDEYLLYRFRRDDGSFPWSDDLALFQRCQNMFKRLESEELPLLQTREEDGIWYSNAFLGSQLIDWLLSQGDFDTREDGVREGRRMLENDVIKHVTDAHHFKDELLLYQFRSSFVASTTLLQDLTRVSSESDTVDIMSMGDNANKHFSRHLSIPNDKMIKPGYSIRAVTVEELEAPGSQFMKKRIRIAQDPVGFGFVLRGEGPVYVQTVDPMGPAAAAGLKVGHYLHSVNDHCVISMNYRDLCHLILGSNGYVNMVVMEYVNDRWR